MTDYLRISVRFLDGAFHGRADGGANEWPPSPLRLFQALVAASAARWNERRGIKHAAAALRWLEGLPAPDIVAPATAEGAAYRLYVPDNVGDLVGKSWSRGNAGNIADYRTEKTVRPTHVHGDGAVHFLWLLEDAAPAAHLETIVTTARSITHLGWGVDLVVADAAIIPATEVATLDGRKWNPAHENGATSLRTPRPGTFDDLEHRHRAFLNRVNGVDGGTFSPVPPLRAYQSVDYRCETDPARPPCAIFALRQLDDSGFRAFDPVRRGLHVAAMLRHVAGGPDIARSLGWSDAQIARLVHGHTDEESSAQTSARLLFLPLPSVEARGQGKATVVGPVRRVLITASGPMKRDAFRRLAQRLEGLELMDEKNGDPVALLSRLPHSDKLTNDNYLAASATWATVTPVVLPGYDDPRKLRQRLRENSGLSAEEKNAVVAKLDQRIELLLRKALRQAGYTEVITRNAVIEWRDSGYLPGTDLASRYMTGDQHRRYRKLHVRIQFRDAEGQPLPIPGPVCIGGGKFSGTGLFAAPRSP
jgi:CRISPR-associated protein Csb2